MSQPIRGGLLARVEPVRFSQKGKPVPWLVAEFDPRGGQI